MTMSGGRRPRSGAARERAGQEARKLKPRLRYTSAPDRRAQLLQLVREQGYCTTTELAEAFAVSDMTIRRDIARLVQEGQLRSVHGGVTALSPHALIGSDFRARMTRMGAAKQAIAERAVAFADGATVIAVDAGTTTLELVRCLRPSRRLKVVTHSLPVLQALLGNEKVDVMCLGGRLHHESQSFSGPTTLAALADLRLQVLFLAASSINEHGVYCGNDFDAVTKRALIDVSDEVVLLADSSKFELSAMVRVCPLETIDRIVVDDRLTDAQHAMLQEHGVEVVTVTPHQVTTTENA